MKSLANDPWATCPITQMGFLRIVTNPSFSPAAPSWPEASTFLRRCMAETRNHIFWPDSLSLEQIDNRFGRRITGPNQITDAYLLALSMHHQGRMVTFDHRMMALAPPGTPQHEALLILKP
jgi:uncharacterized protein